MKPLYNSLFALILATGIGMAGHAPLAAQTTEIWRQQTKSLESAERTQSTAYIENRGQWDSAVRFLARWNGLDVWVGADGIVYDLYRLSEPKARASRSTLTREFEPRPSRPVRDGHVVRMRFVGADAGARAEGTTRLPGVHNYFVGDDPAHWATNVPLYGGARINGLYRGIDAVLYTDGDLPRYDLVVAPGANASAVRLEYDGAKSLRIDAAGDLVIGTSIGEIRQQGLLAYQNVGGRRATVPCSFRKLPGGAIGFSVGAYDRTRPLVIDPVVYSTLIAPDGYARGFDVALDALDNAYLTGYTGSAIYPTSPGAYQGALSGLSIDAYVTKISNDGRNLIYSTYLGGTNDDVGLGIAADALGMIYVVGYTYSNNFPTKSAVDNTFGGRRDAFVTKLDQNGSGPTQQLIYSTYLGGTGGDFAADVVARNGDAYVVGYTDSPDFNIANAFQPLPVTSGPNQTGEAFVSHISAGGATLIGSTYLGGDAADIGRGIALDPSGNVWVTGTTYGSFPVNGTARAYDSTKNGTADGFVARLDPTTSTLLYGTFIGGAADDNPTGIRVDAAGYVHIAGNTAGAYPTTSGSFQPTYNGGISDMFITKFVPGGGALAFSTLIGGNNDDYANDVAVDGEGNVWVAGMSVGGTFPFTTNAIQPFRNGNTFDIAIAAVNSNGTRQIYGSYYGGTDGDSARSIAVASDGTIVMTGSTYSRDFPTTLGSYRPTAPLGTYLLRLGMLRVSAPRFNDVYCGGDNVEVKWSGAANASYDVYLSADSGQTYKPIATSVTGTSYTWFIPIAQAAGGQYRLRVASSTGSEADFSGAFTIFAPPQLTTQPASLSTPPGGNASFIAQATGNPEPTIRWQRRSGNTWIDLPSDTSTILKLTNVAAGLNGTYFRAAFTNRCRTVFSDSALLTVPSVELLSPLGGEAFCAGSQATIRWQAIADNGPVNIYVSTDGGLSWLSIARSVTKQPYTWKVPATYSGSTYMIRVELNDVLTSDSSDATFTVMTSAHATKSPIDARTVPDGTVSYSAQGNGLPAPTVAWQVDSGAGWEPLQGATEATLTVRNARLEQNGSRYRAVFTNECGSDTTLPAKLTVTFETEGVDDEAGTSAALLAMSIQPNPASADAALAFTLPRTARVTARLLDMRGVIVATIADAVMSTGAHRLGFSTAGLPNGTYVAELAAGSLRASVKLTVAH